MVSYSQVQKGDISFGANVGYLSQKGDADINSYSFTSIGGSVQYYVTDNISIGFGPAIGRTSVLGGSTILKTTAWNFSVDYAFLSSTGKVMPYFGARYSLYTNGLELDTDGFIPGATNFGLGSIEYKYKRQIAAVSAGVKFFITERINIDNNFTLGSVIKQTIDFELGGLGGPISADGPTGDLLVQFTVGFGYIIGARGT